jgi:hypothetical protein
MDHSLIRNLRGIIPVLEKLMVAQGLRGDRPVDVIMKP